MTGPARAPSVLWSLGLFRSELVTVLRRWRTLALLGVLAAVPVLIGIAVKIETGGGGGGRGGGGERPRLHRADHQQRPLPGLRGARRHPAGLPADGGRSGRGRRGRGRGQLGHPALSARRPGGPHPAAARQVRLGARVLPDSHAGGGGSPRSRSARCSSRSATSRRSPARRSPSRTGCCGRVAIAGVVAVSLSGMAALGLFISTLTNSGIAAMASTVGLLITVQILGQIPQLHAIAAVPLPALLAVLRGRPARAGLLGPAGEELRTPGPVRRGLRLGGLGALHDEGHHGVTPERRPICQERHVKCPNQGVKCPERTGRASRPP